MNKKEKADLIIKTLNEQFPNPKCALNYNKDYELLIAVMLSAQTTDKAVNKVTEILFEKYSDIYSLAHADINDVEEIIGPIGMKKKKASNVINIAKELFNLSCKVPNDINALISLPGVGKKTAEVTLLELYDEPYFPVDTHINRISKRWKIAQEKDSVETVETKLNKFFPKESWNKLHRQIIYFGRNTCHAINPKCKDCKLQRICKK